MTRSKAPIPTPMKRRRGPWPGVAHAVRLLLVLCGLAGTAPAMAQSADLDAAVSRLSQRLVQQLELKGRLDTGRVFVSSLDFFHERNRQNLPLSATLYGRFSDELSNRGVGIELSEDDAQGVMVLQGTWRELSGAEGIWLTVKIRERSGGGHRLVASADGLVRQVEEPLLIPDLESWGRYAVGRLEHGLSGHRAVSLVPFSVQGAGKPEELGRYLDEYWLSEAFTRSRRFTLMESGASSDGELRVSAHVVGEHLQISLRIVDGQGTRLGAATIRKLATALLPGHFLGPDVAGLLGRCAEHFDGGRLPEAGRCYAQVLEHDPWNDEALAGRRQVEREMARAEREAEERRLAAEAEARRIAELTPEMVRIEGGSFWMGSPGSETGRYDNEGRHEVHVESFSIGKYEVTRGQYARFVGETGRAAEDACWTYESGEVKERSGRGWRTPGYGQEDTHPVVCVSHDEAVAYARWLSEETGERYRLPTEAEWEYAARAGTETAYPWGDSVGHNRANCDGCGSRWDNRQTAPAGSFEANGWGLHDTVGNVWEWTCSEYDEGYGGGEKRCATVSAGRRVIRGGSWSDDPGGVRSANRFRSDPGTRTTYLGFRLAQD